MKFVLPREAMIPNGAIKVADKKSDAVAYLYPSPNGKPAAMVFFGKQNKPIFRHYYLGEKARDNAIRSAFEGRQASQEYTKKRRQERVSWVPDYKVGEILHTSWGYDQTNVEFFEITEVKGKYVILREVAQEREETGYMTGNCSPKSGCFLNPRHEKDEQGVPIRRLAQQTGIKIDDVRTAWRSTDRKYRWSSYA